MNLFNILKKKKESGLDLPPPPPIPKPIRQERLILPKLPEVPEFKPIPRFEPVMNIPKFEPKIPKPIEFKSKIIPEHMFKPSVRMPEMSIPKFRPSLVSEPIKQLEPRKQLEKSYINVDDFRDIMEHINEVKKKIKESEEALTRLNEIKNEEDREFEKWHSKFEDVQRKLVYIDKFLGG